MSHPSLGLAPIDMTAGFPDAARRFRAAAPTVSARALEIAVDADPTIAERHGEIGLRSLLQDTRAFVEIVARSLESGDPVFVREWADMCAPVFRRRKVSMDDLTAIAEGIRRASESVLAPGERGPVDVALDEAETVFKRYRRIAGDARRKNRILQFIYKGA